jgi:hypothetical protein
MITVRPQQISLTLRGEVPQYDFADIAGLFPSRRSFLGRTFEEITKCAIRTQWHLDSRNSQA